MSSGEQYPFVNIFKQFGVGQWKRCTKEGDVTPVMDRDMKATVYRISGTVVSANYIQLPKATSQSLGLTGRFLYLLFRPLPSKLFSVHLELATIAGPAMRVSLSNIFKEFKSTSTWLQFPFSLVQSEGAREREREKLTLKRQRWTLLVLDLRSLLNDYLNTEFAYLKNIQLCANLLVRGVFTSHTEYSPTPGGSAHLEPLPREMRFPLGKSEEFSEVYDYVRFPQSHEVHTTDHVGERDKIQNKSSVRVVSVSGETSEGVRRRKDKKVNGATSRPRAGVGKNDSVRESVRVRQVAGSGVHVYAERGAEINVLRDGQRRLAVGGKGQRLTAGGEVRLAAGGEVKLAEESSSSQTDMENSSKPEPSVARWSDVPPRHTLPTTLEPDPIMELRRVIGFGGHTTSRVLFPVQGCVVYPSHHLVVISDTASGDQRFLTGHTAQVSSLACNGAETVLASGQTGFCASVRLWDFESGQCLSLFQSHSNTLSYLSFSRPGSLLCGLGRDRHSKSHLVLWDTSPVAAQPSPAPGEVSPLTQAHTDVSITAIKIAHFDEKRMVSCGRDNVRFWRVKGGTLRSCSVTLGNHHHGDFTDVLFQPGYPNGSDIYNRNVYACTKSGHMFEIHYGSVSLKRVWQLLPGNGGGVAITALCLHEMFSVTGSEDGVLRVWPPDFSSTFLEAGMTLSVLRLDITPMTPPPPLTHSPSSAHLVTFSPSSLNQLLVVTSSGEKGGVASLLKFSASTGQLLSQVSDIHRSHCTAVALTSHGQHIITAGDSGSVKVWDYSMAPDLNPQVFVGHSGEVSQILVSPDGRHIITTASAIFFWDFLSLPDPLVSASDSSLLSVSPRVGPPAPTNYEPLKCHQFTPRPTSFHNNEKKKSVRISLRGQASDKREVGGEGVVCEGVTGEERGCEVGYCESSDDDEVHSEDNGDVIIEHSSDEEVHVEVPSISSQSTPSQSSHDHQAASHSMPVAEKHYKPRPPHSSLAAHLYMAPPDEVGIERKAVLGMSGRGRGNVVWQAGTGLFAYSSGCIVVIEDLSKNQQIHLTGHSEEVSTLAVRGDGKALASSSHAHNSTPCEIRIWKLPTNKCSKVLKFHSHAVTSMAFSRDDRFLLSLGDYHDNTLAVWSTYDYSLAVGTSLSLPSHQLAWDPHTAYEFVSVGAAMSLCFWLLQEEATSTCQLKVHEADIPTDLVQGRERSEVDFTATCYGPHHRLFVGSSVGVVSMWDTSQNSCIMFWKTIPKEIGAMWCSGGKLAVGSVTGRLALWGVGGREGESLLPTVSLQTELELDSSIFSLSFDQDLKLGVAGSADGCVWYINWPEGTKVKLVCGHTQELVGVASSSDGQLLATACRNGSVTVWNMDSLEQTVAFHAPKKECLCVAFAPVAHKKRQIVAPPTNEKGQPHRLAAGYSDGSVRVFSVESGSNWSERKMKTHGSSVTNIAFSVDGRMLLVGSEEGMVAVSSVSSGLVVKVIQDHRGAPITDVCVASRPLQLTSAGTVQKVWLWACASGDRRVSVWSGDWSQGVCHLTDWLSFPGPPYPPNDASNLSKGEKGQCGLMPPSLVRFHTTDPDTLLYTGYGLETCLQFYSISQKTVLRKFALTHWATCMDISPQGHLIALGCSERILKLMDYSEGSFQDFSGHSDSVQSLVFSLSGQHLISTTDSLTHIWTLKH